MGFRFRKSIKIAPGVRVNVSKTGVSTSLGVKGASLNVGKQGLRSTVGLPGSGISYSTLHGGGAKKSAIGGPASPSSSGKDTAIGCGCVAIIVAALVALIATCSSQPDTVPQPVASMETSQASNTDSLPPEPLAIEQSSSSQAANSEADEDDNPCRCDGQKLCYGKRGGAYCIDRKGKKHYER